MENIKCLCGEDICNNNAFKKHFQKCKDFKNKFSDLDFKISQLLKMYNPKLVNLFLMNYIQLIQKITNHSNINFSNNIRDEDINSIINNVKKNININNEKNLGLLKNYNKDYEKMITDDKFIRNINYKLIFVGSDIKKEQYEGIIGLCVKNYLDNKKKKVKISESILENLEKIMPGKWLVLISEKNSNNYFDCTLSLTNNNGIIIFSLENKKFNLISLKME